jgi:predicted GNAT superfamily acetyltransferase
MTIRIEPLGSLAELGACADLQRAVLGQRARTIWHVPALVGIRRSGGLVLGAYDGESRHAPIGALVDLRASVDGYPTCYTVFRAVHPTARNRGIARALRTAERRICQEEAVDLVLWDLDPLRSVDAHLAFNRLGAISTGYARDLYGEVHDEANLGLATDRLRVEWWIDAPRVVSIVDREAPPPHYRVGIHEMEVMTETRLQPNGARMITGFRDAPRADHVLAEIPVDLDRIRHDDPAAAREWRVQSRAVFELLFESGYVGTGFVHEGGRSFHLYRRANRGAALRET